MTKPSGWRKRLYWWLWDRTHGVPGLCPANTINLPLYGKLGDPRIGRLCREDAADNGRCWCGKIGWGDA